MDVDKAKAAGALAQAIEAVNAKLTMANTASQEAWPLTEMKFMSPSGQGFDALTFGHANEKDTTDAMGRVLAYLQAQLDALNAQLAAL